MQPSQILGSSPQTQALVRLVRVLAPSASTVLVTGESGTGKELVAQALHGASPRRDGPFVPVNCGAIPRDLLESELFGHRRGAFTGALADRQGRFETADGGTLFLDEIGDLPLDMQVKLLRVLQDRAVTPVGAARPVAVDVRIVAATHKDLAHEVAQGRFREDLYYRLNVLPCHTTPLRERPQDIAELLAHYARRHAAPGCAPVRFADDMHEALLAYAWPGNVRELSNLVDRYSTLFPGECVRLADVPESMLPPGLARRPARPAQPAPAVAPPAVHGLHPSFLPLPASVADEAFYPLEPGGLDLAAGPAATAANARLEPAAAPPETSTAEDIERIVCLAQGTVTLPPDGLSLKEQLVRIERSLIEQALARTRGNVSQTARLLQLQRTTLIEKINKYELRAG